MAGRAKKVKRNGRKQIKNSLTKNQRSSEYINQSRMAQRKKFLILTGILAAIGVLVWLAFSFFGVQALFLDRTVNESPVAGEQLLAQGTFQKGDSTYSIHGTATITEENGVRTLSLTDFQVTNGPDLFVYVVSAANGSNPTVKSAVGSGSFVNLGTLKGNIGNQTYALPSEVVIDKNSVISIWCRRFSRNFGTADLVPAK